MEIKIPEGIIEAHETTTLIPFIGAGVSKFINKNLFPNWDELLAGLIQESSKNGYIEKSKQKQLDDLLNLGNHLTVAEQLKQDLPNDYYFDYLEKKFDVDSTDGFDFDIYLQIYQLRPPIIITTNYDRLLEDAYARIYRKNMDVKTYSEAIGIIKLLQRYRRTKGTTLFKIHGDVRDPQTMVLTEKDYRMVMYDMTDHRMAMSSIFAMNTVLFLGFSMSDKEMMANIDRQRHAMRYLDNPNYMLVREGSYNEIQRTRWRDDFGIHIIDYEYSEDHEGIHTWLKALNKKMTGDKG